MLTLILQELVQIRKELQTLNKSLEPKKKRLWMILKYFIDR